MQHLSLLLCIGIGSLVPSLTACGTDSTSGVVPPTVSAPEGDSCVLGALTATQRARQADLTRKVVTVVSKTSELPNGYEFTLPGTFRETGEWLDSLRVCCPTLNVDASFPARGGAVVIRMSGGPDAKEFIREEFPPLFKQS